MSLAQAARPADSVLFADKYHSDTPYAPTPACGASTYTNAQGNGIRYDDRNYANYWTCPNIGPWHQQGSNLAFIDGHVKYQKAQKIYDDLTDTQWVLQ